jgi:hypothetical protein
MVGSIRTHWHIENRLHWGGTDGEPASPYGVPFKDVVFCEDTSPRLKGLASINLSILKSWVINLLRSQGYDSITEAINYLSHALKALCSLCLI